MIEIVQGVVVNVSVSVSIGVFLVVDGVPHSRGPCKLAPEIGDVTVCDGTWDGGRDRFGLVLLRLMVFGGSVCVCV